MTASAAARDRLLVAPGLALPADVITQTLAILAVKRAGKSNAAVVLAERMFAAGLPFVVIDPKGDWWGLRSNADGTGPGLQIPILGGSHGDVPITPGGGRVVADLVVGQNLTCVLDVSDLDEGEDRLRFLADFGDQLYRLHKDHPQPRHVYLEEAHEVIPQSLPPGAARCRRVWIRIVKMGGTQGLGVTIISQRSAAVDKDGLSQIETLVAMRTSHDRDLDAVNGWIKRRPEARGILEALPALADGEAYVVSPQWLVSHGQPAVQQVRFARRTTFDSGRTPTMAAAARPPATLASIDLAGLAERMAQVTEEAEHSDPALLRRRIATLEAEVRRLAGELEASRSAPPRTEYVPVVLAADLQAGQQLADTIRESAAALAQRADSLEAALAAAPAPPGGGAPGDLGGPAAPSDPPPVRRAARRARPVSVVDAADPIALDPAAVAGLRLGERKMLTVLARSYPVRLTRAQLGAFAKFAPSGGTFRAYLRTLIREGLAGEDGGFIVLTGAGEAATGVDSRPPVTAAEFREIWRRALRRGERDMLDILIARHPEPVTRPALAPAVGRGMEPSGGTFRAYVRTLVRNGLASEDSDGLRAADALFSPPVPVRALTR